MAFARLTFTEYMASPKMYLHYAHSSVQVLPSGILKEVRRGAESLSRIQNPNNWISVDEWMNYANQLQVSVYVNPLWTDDLKWLAQWFRHETLRLSKNTKTYWNYVCNQILTLREAFLQTPTQSIFSKLHHFEAIYANMYKQSKSQKYWYEITQKRLPKMLIQDQFGYMRSLYVCLSAGTIAVDSVENVGRSFAELGIQPTAFFNREFGVYYRVL